MASGSCRCVYASQIQVLSSQVRPLCVCVFWWRREGSAGWTRTIASTCFQSILGFLLVFLFCLWVQEHEHMAQSAFANASGTLFTPHSGHAGRFVILSRVFVFCWLSTPISLSTSTWRSPHTSHQSLQDEWGNRIRLKHRQCPMVGGTTGTVFARYDALNPIVCNKTQNSPKGFVREEMASQQKAGLGTLRTQPRQALKLPASAESDSLHKA